MEPILLTEFGDYLVLNKSLSRLTNEDLITVNAGYIGIHQICNGFIDLRSTSETHNTLLCRTCFLRVYIPKKITIYEDLRRYCQQILRVK